MTAQPSRSAKLFLAACVLVLVGVSLLAAGIIRSPAEMRRVKTDAVRVSDLRLISREAEDFWREKARFPQSLAELAGTSGGHIPLFDPETEKPYGYRVTGERSFEVCADFVTSNRKRQDRSYGYVYGVNNWRHDKGKECFETEVEADDE